MAERALSTRARSRASTHKMDSHQRDLLVLRALRMEFELTIQRFVDILDRIDAANEDREEDDFGGGDVCDEPHDDEGDAEPWLGSPEASVVILEANGRVYMQNGSQLPWAKGCDDDRELDPAEMGIGDSGGLSEQQGGAL